MKIAWSFNHFWLIHPCDGRSRVRLTINGEDELERSRWWASTSATRQSSSVRYTSADPCRHFYTRTDCLQAIRSGAFSKCSWRRSGVLCWRSKFEFLRSKTNVARDENMKIVFCAYLHEKWNQFRSNQEQTDFLPILHILSDTYHHHKCFVLWYLCDCLSITCLTCCSFTQC